MTELGGRLRDRVALITGASRGIGRAIALGFAHEGADLILASRKRQDLETVVNDAEHLGRRALAVAANLSSEADVNELCQRVEEEFGRLDILVNNAATNPYMGPLCEATPEVFDKTLDLNLRGPFLLIRRCRDLLRRSPAASIINIGSTAGLRPSPMLGIYSISKAGLHMMTRVLARELAPEKIRVNTLAPGLTRTRFSSALWAEGREERAASLIPLGRIGEPDDMVEAALYLASGDSAFVTGQVIVLDGGATA
ncbi:MAG: hypothetical protein A2V67_06855 [Deltaproteobacteria bacterium RBG_13_61_14]|jgi:NAD(P)-dependent dehydrogenase (short-subunit alcohol dehydrogenase family)|nr:MAG: hypothetical protein A2V67_06855 [Deltaproteobacteria bacterium RBG_13_61_14]